MKKLALSALMLTSALFAESCVDRFFVEVQSGYSSSMDASISAGDDWDPSPEGYSRDIGGSAYYQMGFGYAHSPCWALQFNASYRPGYTYEQFQTSTAINTPNFLGTKTRYFNLSSTTFMADLTWNKFSDYYRYCFDCVNMWVSPFIGAGIGVSYNNLYNFHSKVPSQFIDGPGTNDVSIPPRVYSIENNFVRQAFAAEGYVGIATQLFCCLNVQLGYKIFYGGVFESNDYVYASKSSLLVVPDPVNGTGEFITVAKPATPWKGSLLANEFFMGIYGRF
jgi:hypothetical protein